MELGHLLLDLLGWVIVWSREGERDRLGREVAPADQPLISLKDVGMSRVLRCGLLLAVADGSGC